MSTMKYFRQTRLIPLLLVDMLMTFHSTMFTLISALGLTSCHTCLTLIVPFIWIDLINQKLMRQNIQCRILKWPTLKYIKNLHSNRCTHQATVRRRGRRSKDTTKKRLNMRMGYAVETKGMDGSNLNSTTTMNNSGLDMR